jgi:hypothetical protein
MRESPKVFLSYAHSDRAVASAVAAELEQAGVRVWMDTAAFRPGEDMVTAIERGIAESDAVVLMNTPAFLNSAESMYELGYVLSEQRSRGATVIPILLDGTGEARSPAFLRTMTMLDGRGRQTSQIAKQILDRLKLPVDHAPLQHIQT